MHLSHSRGPSSFSLAIHGGAGPRGKALTQDERAAYESGLQKALRAGREILGSDGSSVDAVCAAVTALEDDELFNAGRGAAVTASATVELDAAVMVGETGLAGAVTGTTLARNPVIAARAVMEDTPHVLIHAPDAALLREWGLQVEDPSYFLTQRRLDQLAGLGAPDASAPQTQPMAGRTALGHGTVGAVARDRAGNLAAATSTGGVTGQMVGRIGDTPIIGAGTYANRVVAISCTGIGEFFTRAVLAHDVAARMAYGGVPLDEAVEAAIREGLTERGGHGGLIGIDASGAVVLAYNTQAMLRGFATDEVFQVEV